MNQTTEVTQAVNDASRAAQAIVKQIGRAFIGQDAVVRDVVTALLAGGHVLIEGVPGLGKTLLVKSLAKCVEGAYARIQFTPDLMPADITGHVIFDMDNKEFITHKGPIFTNLLLADEINRAPAKTQAALLEVMQEYQATIEGTAYPVPKPFMTLATQNPIEQDGTYPLPDAQLDRFLFKILIDYPTADDEVRLVSAVTHQKIGDALDVDNVKSVVKPEFVAKLQKFAARLRVDGSIIDYAVRLARASRQWEGIQTGAGSRGSIALIRGARGAALLQGRTFVTPDDIKSVFLQAFRHRIQLTPDVQMEGHSPDTLLQGILEQVDAPRE